MPSKKPLFLVSNDDGIHSKGLHLLAQKIALIGEVYVVAPHMDQTAASHTLTIRRPLHVEKLHEESYSSHVYAVNGSPADCVLIALNKILPRNPDMIVSGINRGLNLATDVLYSGTVAAAMEGAMNGFAAMAFSTRYKSGEEIRFDTAAEVAYKFVRAYLNRDDLRGLALNVNVPLLPYDQLKGTKIARTGVRTSWENMYCDYRDPIGRMTYWIGPNAENYRPDPGSDVSLFNEGWVTASVLRPSMLAEDMHEEISKDLPKL